jgi:acyl-CoA thioesterase-1
MCVLWLIAPQAWAVYASEKVILVLGDSLSAGYGMGLEQSWPALLEQRLSDDGFSLRVENASISGETTSGGLRRLPALLEQHEPCIVVVELGANDGLRGIAINEIDTNFRRMLDQIVRSGATILLLEMRIPPNYGQKYSGQFLGVYRDLEDAYDLHLVPFFLHNVVLDRSLMQADGLHPNALAQPKMLENVWVYLANEIY